MAKVSLTKNEELLLNNVVAFNKETNAFDFANKDYESHPDVVKFNDPRRADFVAAAIERAIKEGVPKDTYIPISRNTLNKDLNPEIKTFKRQVWYTDPETGISDWVEQEYFLKDADSDGAVYGSDGPIVDEDRKTLADTRETSKIFKDPKATSSNIKYKDYAYDSSGNLVIRPGDPIASVQCALKEQILINAEQNGFVLKSSIVGYDGTSDRPLHEDVLVSPSGEQISLSLLLTKTGAQELHNVTWKQPSNDAVNTLEKHREAENFIKKHKLGIQDTTIQARLKVYDANKEHPDGMLYDHLSKISPKFNNKKKENENLNKTFSKNPGNMLKIGDVWLNVPPTHLLISQLRSNQAIPILGGEARGVSTPITNRTIIKINLVFQGLDEINNNLARILHQFKYVPINIIRSYDLWKKLSRENKFLSSYEKNKEYCVPVTMDSYNLYTIEGHPFALGLSLSFSLFNTTPYFNGTAEKLQYIRYNENFYDNIKTNDRAVVKTNIRAEAQDLINVFSNPTVDIEESVHPYNFLIEHERENNLYDPIKDNESKIIFSKIKSAESVKEFFLYIQSAGQPFKEEDVVSYVMADAYSDNAHSISLSFNNNFAWIPVLEQASPTAQYIGPGETNVSINIKTNDPDTIENSLRTYADIIDADKFGNFETRYFIKNPVLDLVNCNILAIQNLVISSIEGKPNAYDVNIMLNKTNFESLANPDNSPVELDSYWGLDRVKRLFDQPKIKQLIDNSRTSIEKKSLLFKIKDSDKVNIHGLNPRFSSDLENAISEVNELYPNIKRNLTKVEEKLHKADPKSFHDITYNNATGSDILNRMEWRQAKPNGEFSEAVLNVIDQIRAKYEAKIKALRERGENRSPRNPGNSNIQPEITKLLYEMDQEIKNITKRSNSDIPKIDDIKRNVHAYKAAYNGYAAIFNVAELSAGERELLKKILVKNKFKFAYGSDQATKNLISVSKVPADIDVPVGFVDKNAMSDVDKELIAKEVDFLLQDEEKLLAKPYAAHRWFNRVDNFIRFSNIFSTTMGYWYYNNRIKNIKSEIKRIEDHARFALDPLMDTDAARCVYMQETFSGFVEDVAANENSFLNIARAFAYPSARKDIASALPNSKYKPEKGFMYAILKKDGEPATRDMPLRSFTTGFFNENFYEGDTAAKPYIDLFHTNNANKYKDESIKPGTFVEAGVTLNEVYDLHNKNFGIIGPDGLLYRTSDLTMKDINPYLDSLKITDRPADRNRGLLNYQKTVRKLLSSFMTKEAQAATKEIPSVKPGFTSVEQAMLFPNEPAKISVDEYKAIKEEKFETNVSNFAIQQFYNSEQPTIGLQNAYPTYKIYVIYDNTSDIKYKFLDTYYDFRLLQDLIVIRDKNNPAHILKCRVVVDPRKISTSPVEDRNYGLRGTNQSTSHSRLNRFESNLGDYQSNPTGAPNFAGGRSPLRQGFRICIKLGYHSDPRHLDTVFIGTITQLNPINLGMYELEARGDGRELTVPVAIQNSSLSGRTFGDLIYKMLRGNPSITHFGRLYGTYLERFSEEHNNLMAFIMSRANVSSLFGATVFGGATGKGVSLASKAIPIIGTMRYTPLIAGAAAFAVGSALYTFINKDGDRLKDAALNGFLKNNRIAREEIHRLYGADAIWQRLNGEVFDAKKASGQVLRHIEDVMSNGHDPIDQNIWALDIWAGGKGSNVNFRANNQKTVWDVLKDIQRIYPGYALDVRPYGSRSTIFLGDPGFDYWRTDDPLLAMAPSLTTLDNIKRDANQGDQLAQTITNLTPKKNLLNDITDEREMANKIAPLVPFMKHHVATSWDNIISNGIKGTPERGWNSVVVSKTADGSGEVINLSADADLFSHAYRRKFAVVDWTDDDRLARYYALGLLKEGVERLYGGTLILRGNSKIEPYDKIYVCDKVNDMYGWIQVETVIHKFDNEMGFTTHVVPNMVCSVNDSSYQTVGDVRKKMLIGKIGNYFEDRGAWGLAADAITLGMGFTGVGLPLALGISMLMDLGVEWNKNRIKRNEAAKQAGMSPDMLNDLNTGAWLQSAVDLKYNFIKDAGGHYIGKAFNKIVSPYTKEGAKVVGRAIVGTASYFFKDIFAGAIATVFKMKTSKEFWKKAIDPIHNKQTKDWASKIKNHFLETSITAQKEASEAVKVAGELKKTNLANAINKVKEKLAEAEKEVTKLKADPSKTKELEIAESKVKKLNSSINNMEEALTKEFKGTWASAKSQAGTYLKETKNKVWTEKTKTNINKYGKYATALLGLWTVTSLLSYPETFCIKAVTDGNIINISPLWFKESLLMPGLEGYRNNDAFMHLKGMYINAKEVYSDMWNKLDDWDVLKLGKDIIVPAGIENSGTSWASTGPYDGLPTKKLNAVEEAIKSPIFDKLNPLILSECKKYNIDPFLIYGIIQQESGWDPSITGKEDPNDRGIMQINIKAHPSMADKAFDPEENIKYGIRFMASLIKKYDGDVFRAARAWNGNPYINPRTYTHASAVFSYRDKFKKVLTGA